MQHARPGDTVRILSGRYPPFVVRTAAVTVLGDRGATIVGTRGASAVVEVQAPYVIIKGLTITGCVPESTPAGGLETGASSGIRIDEPAYRVTITGNTVADGRGVNTQGQQFGCYGIFTHRSSANMITSNTVFHNGYGIALSGGGGTVVADNTVHDNDVLIQNTVSSPSDDFGAIGIGFGHVSGAVAERNLVYNNSGPSHDWGSDGGAFEIFASSHISIAGNRIYNNDDVLETGGGSASCDHNTFTENIASGRTTSSRLPRSVGLILRCAQSMEVSGNHVSDVDWWTFWIYNAAASSQPSSVGGLRITGNTVIQRSALVYAVGPLGPGPELTINANRYSSVGTFASTTVGKVGGLARWRDVTGWDTTSSQTN